MMKYGLNSNNDSSYISNTLRASAKKYNNLSTMSPIKTNSNNL